MKYFILGFYLMLQELSCNTLETDSHSSPAIGDTTRVLVLAIRTAFYHGNLPEIYTLYSSRQFNDSIWFTSDSLPLSILPKKVDSINFKILKKDQIRKMLTVGNTDTTTQKTNFLLISAFEKNDTGYYVIVESRSCLKFGGGGSFGLEIKKEKDSFIVKSIMSSSIN